MTDVSSLILPMAAFFVLIAYLALDMMNRSLPKPFGERTIVTLACGFGLCGLLTTLFPVLRIVGLIVAFGITIGYVWWLGNDGKVANNSCNPKSSVHWQHINSLAADGNEVQLQVATFRTSVTPGRYLVSQDGSTWDWAELKEINGQMTHEALPKSSHRDDPLELISLAVVGVAIVGTIVLVLLTQL